MSQYKEFPVTIAPANTSETGFPIAMLPHIAGSRVTDDLETIQPWQLLGEGSTLTLQKAAAIGQIWYVTAGTSPGHYVLKSWTGTDPTWERLDKDMATEAFVTNKISNIPVPMIFKGTIGTGGTETTLPTADTSTGFTYKVITEATYSSIPAKVGDLLISNGVDWVLIPSGDELVSVATANTIGGIKSAGDLSVSSTGVPTVKSVNIVGSLPTTGDFLGMQVTYQGRSYIWDGTEWKCDSDTLGGFDSDAFATHDHDHNTTYLGIDATATDSDKLDGLNSTEFVRQLVSNFSCLLANTEYYIGTISSTTLWGNGQSTNGEISINNISGKCKILYTAANVGGVSSLNYNIITSNTNLFNLVVYRDSVDTSLHLYIKSSSLLNYVPRIVIYFNSGMIKLGTEPTTKIAYLDSNIGKSWDSDNFDPATKADLNHNHDTTYLGITATAADSEKLDGINSTGFAQLENGKIKATNLPDYLLGQVLYGGSINASQACTLSSLYKDKFNTTDTTRLLANLSATPHVGVYFIASGNFLLNGTIDVNVGDWVISNGVSWIKIDNTDAVASVNGKVGVVNIDYDDLGDMPVATATEVGGIKIDFTPGNSGVIPIKLDDSNSKAYIELLADNIRYAIANDTIVTGKKYWLKNRTIIIPDSSVGVDSDYSEGLRIANSPSSYSLIALGTDNTTAAAEGLNSDGKQWNIIKHPNGELTISFDNGFVDTPTNSNRTGLTLYKNGDIYWKNTKLNLQRVSPTVSGWLHYSDFTRFDRVADHAQITLTSEEVTFNDSQTDIGGDEIFGNGNASTDFDDFRLYDDSGGYLLIEGRRYEVIINMGMRSSMVGGITLNLEEEGAVIKSTSTTANIGYLSMSLSCIVNGGNPNGRNTIAVSIQKSAGIVLDLMPNQCWFAVHEIK